MNGSVKLLGISADACGFPFIENTQAPNFPSGWGVPKPPIKTVELPQEDIKKNVPVAWCSTVPACTSYILRSLENLRFVVRRVCDDFHHLRCHELERRRSRSCNSIFIPRVNHNDDDLEDPLHQ